MLQLKWTIIKFINILNKQNCLFIFLITSSLFGCIYVHWNIVYIFTDMICLVSIYIKLLTIFFQLVYSFIEITYLHKHENNIYHQPTPSPPDLPSMVHFCVVFPSFILNFLKTTTTTYNKHQKKGGKDICSVCLLCTI